MRSRNGMWEILPGQLYQSGNWMALSPEQKEIRLRLRGVTMIVNAWKVDPDLQAMRRYAHVPFPDGAADPPGDVLRVAQEAAAEIDRGGVVLTMCYRGRNRSALLSTMVVALVRGVSGAEAVTLVRRQRPNAMSNPRHPRYVETLDFPLSYKNKLYQIRHGD